MKHERHHWLEKLQVEFAGGAALAFTFFAVGPMHGWWDPQWPATFVSTGSFLGLLKFALLVWVLAAVCAAITVSSRPEGALLSTLVGAVGVSMHSEPIRVLFWARPEALGGVFAQLIAELLILFAVVVVTIHIIRLVRGAMARVRPDWMWKGRITAETVAMDSRGHEEPLAEKPQSVSARLLWALSPVGGAFADQADHRRAVVSPGGESLKRKAELTQMLSCMAATVLCSSIMLMLLMQSSNRGQIIFALMASFLLATLIAHQQFATRFSVTAWAAPIITGVLFYALSIASSGRLGANAWIKVQFFARALPIDWMTAGGAGGVLGYWLSERVHELKHIERHIENESN